MGDLSTLRDTLSSSPALVNYRRRIGDGTTALMAAAFVGDMDSVWYFLSLGAKASLVDFSGKTAAVLAGMRGHRECFAELQRVADQEVGGSQDYVYDLYYFSPTESRVNSQERGSGRFDQTGVEKCSPLDRVGDEVCLVYRFLTSLPLFNFFVFQVP